MGRSRGRLLIRVLGAAANGCSHSAGPSPRRRRRLPIYTGIRGRARRKWDTDQSIEKKMSRRAAWSFAATP